MRGAKKIIVQAFLHPRSLCHQPKFDLQSALKHQNHWDFVMIGLIYYLFLSRSDYARFHSVLWSQSCPVTELVCRCNTYICFICDSASKYLCGWSQRSKLGVSSVTSNRHANLAILHFFLHRVDQILLSIFALYCYTPFLVQIAYFPECKSNTAQLDRFKLRRF